MKKIITKSLVVIFFVGIVITLVSNCFFQVFREIEDFKETAEEHFVQIERILEKEEGELAKVKSDFAEDCIIRARAAAYIAQHYPSVIENKQECELVASLLQVDELHFFDADGMIYAGTHPEYYGIGVTSGEQIGFFAPMLEDQSLELCQDITPNTAEAKLMQYAAVWRNDGKGIVQVGLEPERVLKALEGNDVSDIFSLISTDTSCDFYAVDSQSNVIIGSIDEAWVGKSMSELKLKVKDISDTLSWGHQKINGEVQYYVAKKTGDLILIKVCPALELHKGLLGNTALLFVYFLNLFLVLILASYLFLDKKIIRSIVNINKKSKQIAQGNWDVVVSENSTAEFTELSSYINNMVESLLSFSGKMSKALELSEVPIGICEYVPDINRFTATGRVKDILLMTDEEFAEIKEHPELFEDKKKEICREEARLEGNIYRIGGNRERFLRVESFIYQKSRMTIFMDVTADIHEKQRIAVERDTDLLTGLFNRRAFFYRMDKLFKHPEQLKNSVMIMIDLDNLKKVNDLYGHADGDRYLLAFSDILHTFENEKKVASRMGGDEFILFAYGYEQAKEAAEVLNKLKMFRDSEKVVLENGEEISLEFSIGGALGTVEDTDYQVLIGVADKKMYEDKKIRKG